MNRLVLEAKNISPDALKYITSYHQKVVHEVAAAVAAHKIVIIGMAMNPFVIKARRALEQSGLDFKYLEYGGYLSMWKPRLAIKLWSGWPTFPQVFVEGKLIGGFKELTLALKSGEIRN